MFQVTRHKHESEADDAGSGRKFLQVTDSVLVEIKNSGEAHCKIKYNPIPGDEATFTLRPGDGYVIQATSAVMEWNGSEGSVNFATIDVQILNES